MEEIAADVELGKASLYYYFPSKEEVFKAVIAFEQNELKGNFEQLLRKQEAAADKLREYVTLRMKFFRDLINLGTLSVHCYQGTKSVFKKLFRGFEKVELILIKKIIDEGIQTNEFVSFLEDDIAAVFLHILQGLRCRILRSANGRDLSQKTRNNLQKEMKTATEIFINGIKCK